MRKFFIGQRVVCIESFRVKRKLNEQCPEKGKTYTIRGFVRYNGQVGILLKEIVNPKHQYADGLNEAAFHIQNFRPAEHQSAITEILQRFVETEERLDGMINEPAKNKETNKQ